MKIVILEIFDFLKFKLNLEDENNLKIILGNLQN
jgi:hypothetical protein